MSSAQAASLRSVNHLVRDIKAYLAERNAAPKPYVWRAKGADILAKIKRARAALDPAKAAWVIGWELRVRTLARPWRERMCE